MTKIKIGLILAGSGVFDGSEIHEATLTLLALDRLNAKIEFISVDTSQHHVVDHNTQSEQSTNDRNCLVESSRIARGPVTNINDIDINSFDGFIFPGGFGVAKNLCTFAIDGIKQSIEPSIRQLVTSAHEQNIPLGFLCISPVIAAALIPNVRLTIGSDTDTRSAIESMGATHVEASVSDIVVDQDNKVVSSPAYMLASRISELTPGIDALVQQVFNWATQRKLATSAA